MVGLDAYRKFNTYVNNLAGALLKTGVFFQALIKGKVLDVAVDIRSGSPTFGQHISVELSEQNKRQLFVPRGFAHGFVVLEDDTIFAYKVDNYYSPAHDRGIAFDDTALNINWVVPKGELKLSGKDTQQLGLSEAEVFADGLGLYRAVG